MSRVRKGKGNSRNPKRDEPANGSDWPESGVALDIGATGIRIAVASNNSVVFPSPLLGDDIPREPIVVLCQPDKPGSIPVFPSFIEIAGSDQNVILSNGTAGQPFMLLERVFTQVRLALERMFERPFDSLAILCPSYWNEPLRQRVVSRALQCGWRFAQVMNRTTSLVAETLQGTQAGNYLSLTLGHGPADVSAFSWDGSNLKALAHANDPKISGEYIDRVLMAKILGNVDLTNGENVDSQLFSDLEWLRFRAGVAEMRHRLDSFDKVHLAISPDFTQREPMDLVVSSKEWKSIVGQHPLDFDTLLDSCAQEAGRKRTDFEKVHVSGGLIHQKPIWEKLCEVSGCNAELHTHHAAMRGALRILAREMPRGEQSGSKSREQTEVPGLNECTVRIGEAREFSQEAKGDPFAAARRMAGEECMEAPIEQLAFLREYIRAVELSMCKTLDGLEKRQKAVCGAPFTLPQQSGEATSAESLATRETEDARRQRRRFLMAREEIKKAELCLRQNRLDVAIGYSHQALDKSSDPRITNAAIEVHLRVARKIPEKPENFERAIAQIMCALSIDPANKNIQEAAIARYSGQVKALARIGTPQAREEGLQVLNKMEGYFPGLAKVEAWIKKLETAPEGSVELEG